MSSAPVAVFRADASQAIGAGHVIRCLSMAETLRKRGWKCVILSSPDIYQTVSRTRLSGFEVAETDINTGFDAAHSGSAIGGYADLLVVDHYAIESSYEKECRGWCKILMSIDDRPVRAHDCDILIDQTLAREPSEYRTLVPERASICTGSAFALLAHDFAELRSISLQRKRGQAEAPRVFMGIGATDPGRLTKRCVDEILTALPKVSITIVLSSAAAGFAEIEALASVQENVTLLSDASPRAVAHEMAAAHVAVGAAGTGTWERCCLGVPTIMLVAADNQIDVANAVDRVGAAQSLGIADRLKAGAVGNAVAELLADRDRRLCMTAQAAKICDGLGASRVADVIEKKIRSF